MAIRAAFKTAAGSYPAMGNRELPISLTFGAAGVILDDLTPDLQQSKIESLQSIFIDNSQNSSPFTIQFFPSYQIIQAQAYTQGIYPIINWGALSYKATGQNGTTTNLIFSNTEKPYYVWGPVPGVTVTPALTNSNVNVALNVGDNVLVPAVAGESVKLYRGIITVGAATILVFEDGPAGTPLFTAYLTAGGSVTFEPSGIPWFVTSKNNGLYVNSSQAVNAYGGLGYVQS